MTDPVNLSSLTSLHSLCFMQMDTAKKDCLKDQNYATYISIWQRCQASMNRAIATYEQTLLHREWKRWVAESSAIEHLRTEVFVQSDARMKESVQVGLEALCEYLEVSASFFTQGAPEDIRKHLFFLSRISKTPLKRKVSYTEFESLRSGYWNNTLAFTNGAAQFAIDGLLQLINILSDAVPAQDIEYFIQVYARVISQAHSLYDLSLDRFQQAFAQIKTSIKFDIQAVQDLCKTQNTYKRISFFFSAIKKNIDDVFIRLEAAATSLSIRADEQIPHELKEGLRRIILISDPEPPFHAAHIAKEAIQSNGVPLDFVMHMMDMEHINADLFIEFISAYTSMARIYEAEINSFNNFMKALCYCLDNGVYLSVLRENPEVVRSLLRYPWTEFTPFHLGSMFRFIGAGATIDQFFVLYKHHGEFGVISEEYLVPQDVAALKQFDLDSLEQVYLLPDRFSIYEKRFMLSNRPLCLFAARFANSTICANDLMSLWELLQMPELPSCSVDSRVYEAAREVLTTRERAFLLTGVNRNLLSIRDFYDLEEGDRLHSVLQSIELSKVPIEPLIRYLSSQSTQECIDWLETLIPIGQCFSPRIETLSEEQKTQIIRRFRRFGSILPQEEWMRAFGIDEHTAFEICRTSPSEPSWADERWHAYVQQKIDPRDPTSLFKALWEEGADRPLFERFQAIVLELLLRAKEHTLCGARQFVSWGNCFDASALCHAQDGRPLLARIQGNQIPIFQPDLFNDPLFPVAAVSLRNRLLKVITTMSKEAFYLREGLVGEALELRYELDRIARHLCDKYSHLGFLDEYMAGHKEDISARERLIAKDKEITSCIGGAISVVACSIQKEHTLFLASEEWRSSTTLIELIKALYVHLTHSESFSKLHDKQSRSSTAAYCLLTLLLLSRYTTITEDADSCSISLSPRTRYRIQSLTLGAYDILNADNSWLDTHQFFEALSEYAPHSATPLSPNRNIGRTSFASFAHTIQSLPSAAFYSLCENCLSLRFMKDSSVSAYVDALKEMSGYGMDIPAEALMSITDLLDHYLSFTSELLRPLEPKAIYYFNPKGLGEFSSGEEIPSALASEGNFASAICHFFTPVLPTSCDGNCCVEAMLLSEKGKDRYRGIDGAAWLKADIRDFRHQVAEFGRKNTEELRAAIGDGVDQRVDGRKEMETVARFLSAYDAPPYTEWTSSAAFFCAARVLHRPIRIFSHPSDVFMTDEHAMVIPSALFTQGVEKGTKPINLMFWANSHYCLLLPKKAK